MTFQVPSVSIQDIKKSPLAVIILFLFCSNIYFINVANSNANLCNARVDKLQARLDSMNGKYFDALVKMKGYKELADLKDNLSLRKDSILREKTVVQAKQIINNQQQ